MIRPQRPLPGREHFPESVLRRGVVAAGRHLLGDGEPGGQRVRMIRPQRPLPGREHVPELILGRGVVAAGRHLLGDGEPGDQRVRMIRPQRPLPGREHVPELIFGRGVVAAGRHLLGDGEPGGQRVRVIRPQRPLPGREHSPESVLRPGVFAACRHLPGEAEPGGQRVRMIRAEVLLLVGQCLLAPRDRLVRAPGLLVRRRHAGISRQLVGVVQSQPVLMIGQRPLVQRHRHVGVVPLESECHTQRISELPAAGVPVGRRLGQGLLQDVVHGRRKVGPPRCERRRRVRQLRVQHGRVVVAVKRRRAGHQREHRAGQRVLVRARIDLLPPDLLGRAVIQRPHEHAGPGHAGRRHRALGQPEIRQVHMIRAAGPHVDQHVGGLNVPVDQPGGVRGIQGRGHRGDDPGRPGRGQWAQLAQQRPHITAGHIAHGDEKHCVRLAGFEHRDDMRIVHGRR